MEMHLAHKFSAHQAAVYGLAYGRRPDTFFSASGDGFVAEWSAESLTQEKFAVKTDAPVYCTLYLENYQLLLSGSATGGMHVVDTKTRQELKLLKLNELGIYHMLHDRQNSRVYVAGGDGIFSVLSLPDFKVLRSIPLTDKKIRQIAQHPNGDSVAVACGDGTIRFLETHFFNDLRTLEAHEGGANTVSWHPQKRVWLTGGKDARLKVWIHMDDVEEPTVDLPAHNFAIYRIVFAPDGERFVTTSRDKTIKLWDARSLAVLQRIDATSGGHRHSVNDAIWLDNNRLITCSDDRQISLFVKTEQQL